MGYDDFDGFDDDDAPRSPKELRDAQRAAAKRAKELEAEVAKLTSQLAQRNLKDVLAEKGLRPGLARVIAKEDVDLTDSKAVDAWLSDPANQEDFGFSIQAAPAAEGAPEGDAGGSDEYAAALAAIQGASNGALPDDKFEQARAQIKSAGTFEETQAALNAALKNLS
jgi:hypothetical protein